MCKISVAVVFLTLSYVSGTTLYPDELTVEYLKNPQAVDSPNPRLAWILKPVLNEDQSIPRNLSQTAFQVLVASTADLLISRKPDLWDSTKIKSGNTFNIKYLGKSLEPGQTVYWAVRVWDQKEEVSEYSKPSTWSNALNAIFWSAKWIGAPTDLQRKALTDLRLQDWVVIVTHNGVKPVLYFRKLIKIDSAKIKQARLFVTAKGTYKVFFNGPVPTSTNQGQPLLSPGWTDYTKTIQYQVYDVTSDIKDEHVTIGAMLGTGWYSGYVGFTFQHSFYGDQEFLLLELHVEYQNGTKLTISSDETWKVTTGPQIYSDILQGELFYEDRNLVNWMKPSYNDSSWSTVITQPLNRSLKLTSESSPQVSVVESLEVKDDWKVDTDVYVYDFGINFAGYVQLTLSNFTQNFTIKIVHGEMLNDDGTVYTKNLRFARAVDTYVCNDVNSREQNIILEPHFTYHGFRYIEVHGLTNAISKNIKGIKIGMKEMFKGTFKTDNDMVNKLHGNILRGQISNMISVPTDCPQRDERLGWMADAQIFAPTAIYNGDVAGFYTKWMRDVREAQSFDGAYSEVSPRLVARNDGAPAWADTGVILTWHMYRMYGDVQIILDNYQNMVKWMSYLSGSNPSMIWENNLSANYGDWLSVNSSTPKEIVSTSYFAYDALLMSYLAKAIGKSADANMYGQLHKKIAEAFNNKFVNKTSGRIEGNTQSCYVLALTCGLLADDLVPKAVQYLVDDIISHDMHLTTGFIGTTYLLPVLSQYGHTDIAYELLLQETFPSWMYTVLNNATTMWERWDGWSKEKGFQSPNMNSFNHYAFGAVGMWMFQYMAGIDTDGENVGFKHIIIKPHIGNGINHTEAVYSSIRGEIRSSWRVENNNFTLEVSIPPNTRATVSLPFLKEKWEQEINSGNYQFNVKLK